MCKRIYGKFQKEKLSLHAITFSKLTISRLERGVRVFQVNIKDTRAISITTTLMAST